MRFPRRARITQGAELQRIVQKGKRIRTAFLEVRIIASPSAHTVGSRTRVGLIVPKFRHSAVARNQVKRRLRELSRTRVLPTDTPADIVIRIRPEAYQAEFAALAADVERAVVELTTWRASVPDMATPTHGANVDALGDT